MAERINIPIKKHYHFSLLIDAIKNVKEPFIVFKDSLDKRADIILHCERVFAYELYHQWRTLLTSYGIKNLVVNAEPPKILNIDINYETRTEERHKKKVFPDLILHHSQGTNAAQEIACEIKRTGNSQSSLFADLAKLSCLLDKHRFSHPFGLAVFILFGKPKETELRIKKKAKIQIDNTDITFEQFINDNTYNRHFNHIAIVEYDVESIRYNTLDEKIQDIIS